MIKITVLVENQGRDELIGVHGLSLYVETADHRLLFDAGPGDSLLHNADRLGVDLAGVDTVVLSHGHADHCGGLAAFLSRNRTATIYVQRRAFLPHASRRPAVAGDVCMDPALMSDPRVRLLDGDFDIDETLSLLTVQRQLRPRSPSNATLYELDAPDNFRHEQSLLIRRHGGALLMGCGHCGLGDILAAAGGEIALCLGGFHLMNGSTDRAVADEALDVAAAELAAHPATRFCTCHCTGTPALAYLKARAGNLEGIRSGDRVLLPDAGTFCLETPRLWIRPLTAQMAATISRLSLDPDNRRFMPDEVFETREDAAQTIAFLTQRYTDGSGPLVYAVFTKDGRHVGHVEAVPLKDGGWEIGYHMGAEYAGRGYATEAVTAFAPVAMAMLDIPEILGICRADNMRSRRVLEKSGFSLKREGTEAEHGRIAPVRRYVLRRVRDV